jgi:hypothetical protein
MTDKVFGALRAESTDTRGVVVMTRSFRGDTRDAVRDSATYRPPNITKPMNAMMLIVRRGFADWRERAPKPLFARDTCVNRISIEMSKRYSSAIAAGITEPACFAHCPYARVIWISDGEFCSEKNWLSCCDRKVMSRLSKSCVLPFVILNDAVKTMIRVEMAFSHQACLVCLNA